MTMHTPDDMHIPYHSHPTICHDNTTHTHTLSLSLTHIHNLSLSLSLSLSFFLSFFLSLSLSLSLSRALSLSLSHTHTMTQPLAQATATAARAPADKKIDASAATSLASGKQRHVSCMYLYAFITMPIAYVLYAHKVSFLMGAAGIICMQKGP